MNKILVPSLLTATILIAGIFAIVDVDRVMAAHLPVLGSAQISTDSITAAELANNAVDTAAVLDDAIEASKLAPNDTLTTAALPFSLKTSTVLIGATTDSINPGHTTSTAIVWCNAAVSPTAHTGVNPTITLTETGTGTVTAPAAKAFASTMVDGSLLTISATWTVTGITDATTFICTVSGTNIVDGDVDYNDIVTIYFPAT